MIKWLKRLLGIKTYQRLELRLLPYYEAERRMKLQPNDWRIAPEEDSNKALGWVYVERVIEVP